MQELIIQVVTIARNIWRFRWYAMLVAWIVSLGGWAYVFKMPDQYESTARVYIDSDSMLKPLLRGIAVESTDFRSQLGAMTRQLLSRPNLEKIMRMTDLDIEANTPREKESLLNELEKNISLNAVPTQRGQLPNIYEISNVGDDAQTVKNVVQSLLTVFLETAIGESREESGVAQQFLDVQIKDYELKLTAAENRLMEYKRKNMGVLPNQGVGIFQRLQNARTNLNQVNLELLEATNRRDEIQRQLDNLKLSGSAVVPPGIAQQPSPTEQRISALQQRLDELQMKYTNQHPAVREATQTLEILLQQQSEKEKLAASDDSKLASNNPVYQQLKIALSEVEAQIAGMKVRKSAYQQRLSDLQKDVITLPEVEAELQRLDRDYEINKKNYNELVKRRESVKLAEHAGESGEEVKFRVIDPPRIPLAPIGPNRLFFSTAVLLLAIGAGLGLAFLLSQIKPVFYDRRAVQEVVQLPVFGVISRVWTPDLLFKRRTQFAAYMLSGVVLMGVYGGVIYFNLKGVDATRILLAGLT